MPNQWLTEREKEGGEGHSLYTIRRRRVEESGLVSE